MIAAPMHRATLVLGLTSLASCVFALTAGLGETFNLIHVRGASVAVLVVLGILATIAGARRIPALGLIAGVGFLGCAVLQLFQLAQPFNLLGGDGSTMALFGGLGIGLVSVWLVGRASTNPSKGTS
jgi:xanthosine utilization system XapX-like protein